MSETTWAQGRWLGVVTFMAALQWLSLAPLAHSAETLVERSARVSTVPLQRGELPLTLTGFGAIAPEAGQSQNVSVPRAGRVERLRVAAGAQVQRGQPLMELAVDPAATQAFAQARNAQQYTEGEVARLEALVAQQLATRSQLAQARQAAADAREAVRVQERLGGAAERITVTAPIAGLLVALPVAQGDRIPAGAVVAQLANTDSLRVALGIEPGDARHVRSGMAVRLASVFDEAHAVTGQVVQMQRAINPKSQLIDAVVQFRPPADTGLLPGLRVRGDIQFAKAEGWLIPRSALIKTGEGFVAFQVADGKAAQVVVQVLTEQGDQAVVKAPFDPQRRLVSEGAYQLTDGMAVREAKS